MTDKVTLSGIAGTYDVTKINENFAAIADALNERVLFRDEMDAMKDDIDLNGKRILNLPAPISQNEPMRKADLVNYEDVQAVFDAAQAASDLANATLEGVADISVDLSAIDNARTITVAAKDTAVGAASAASASADTATTKAAEIVTAANTATTKASEASTSAATATTKAGEAAGSATTATTQAGIATTKAGEAATSATNAATSATNAAASVSGKQSTSEKDATWGYVGLTGYKVNFKADGGPGNGTVVSQMTNANTASRTYTFPDKSGTVAMTSDMPTSTMVLVGSATVGAAVANIDFLNIFTSAYDRYVIDIQGLLGGVANDSIALRLAIGGVAQTTNAYYVGAETGALSATSSYLLTPFDLRSGFKLSATVTVSNTNETGGSHKPISAVGGYLDGTVAYRAIVRAGVFSTTGAATGFRLFQVAGTNFTGGTVRVYGIKNS